MASGGTPSGLFKSMLGPFISASVRASSGAPYQRADLRRAAQNLASSDKTHAFSFFPTAT